jgi:hypothetical protein
VTTKTQLSLKNMGKPHHKPQTPSGGTGGWANARSISTENATKARPKNIGGGTANTYYANSRAISGGTSRRDSSLGPTSYTNFVITKKGRKK